jgi:hypothetical protein
VTSEPRRARRPVRLRCVPVARPVAGVRVGRVPCVRFGAAAFLRKSIDAAKEAQVANSPAGDAARQQRQVVRGLPVQIDKTTLRLSALAGIQDDELKQASLTTILRTVPNVSKALRDLGTAADLARAKHISLAQAATIIAKTEAGNTTLLRRQGFQIAKNATAEQALATVRAVVAGQARAGTTEQERFGAVLHTRRRSSAAASCRRSTSIWSPGRSGCSR